MQQSNQVFQFPLNISYEDFLPYYRGQVTKVEVVDLAGRTLWISARHFRPFFTRSGIKAYFEMVVDSQGNLIQLNKI
ncbi:Conserved hypothetical protein [Shewanella piezotolerans WP3]|uniref:DUF2835 family protein n=1 Tax=Shewanella piezotolerans (strain WP3 / JCM 13877) TaxID=225849 RepID=B8CPG6_SHEPW|nr:DUF2835 domain-containing protein [Shewanella piezotolerans]ACJ29542.1 Conserved hypothetical protein [Shewanella piezotolerans WP3]